MNALGCPGAGGVDGAELKKLTGSVLEKPGEQRHRVKTQTNQPSAANPPPTSLFAIFFFLSLVSK